MIILSCLIIIFVKRENLLVTIFEYSLNLFHCENLFSWR
uniref:Uncharacterized protein n=1 Tax=Wuchereria bancrofti TaxID=6293 RepID=A0AAF5PNG1_WUCBA